MQPGEHAVPVSRKRGRNTTPLASIAPEGMGPSLAVEGDTSTRVFEIYVERALVPSLLAGQIVMMNNSGLHRPER